MSTGTVSFTCNTCDETQDIPYTCTPGVAQTHESPAEPDTWELHQDECVACDTPFTPDDVASMRDTAQQDAPAPDDNL